jgi:hypothetical protein
MFLESLSELLFNLKVVYLEQPFVPQRVSVGTKAYMRLLKRWSNGNPFLSQMIELIFTIRTTRSGGMRFGAGVTKICMRTNEN